MLLKAIRIDQLQAAFCRMLFLVLSKLLEAPTFDEFKI